MPTIITGAVSFLLSPIGRIVGAAALIFMAYLAGDVRGRRVEHEKCEAAAAQARLAAAHQDADAQQQAQKNNLDTLSALKDSKEKSDARVRELEGTIANSVISCNYGDGGKPAGGVRDGGKGAGDAPVARPARIPTPRARPTGDKG